MSAAAQLAGMGLVLSIAADGRGLAIEGLQQLTHEARARALRLAKGNRLLILAEVKKAGGILLNPWVAHFRNVCPDYWRGCLVCKDANLSKLEFCKRHPMPEEAE